MAGNLGSTHNSYPNVSQCIWKRLAQGVGAGGLAVGKVQSSGRRNASTLFPLLHCTTRLGIIITTLFILACVCVCEWRNGHGVCFWRRVPCAVMVALLLTRSEWMRLHTAWARSWRRACIGLSHPYCPSQRTEKRKCKQSYNQTYGWKWEVGVIRKRH